MSVIADGHWYIEGNTTESEPLGHDADDCVRSAIHLLSTTDPIDGSRVARLRIAIAQDRDWCQIACRCRRVVRECTPHEWRHTEHLKPVPGKPPSLNHFGYAFIFRPHPR